MEEEEDEEAGDVVMILRQILRPGVVRDLPDQLAVAAEEEALTSVSFALFAYYDLSCVVERT